MKFKKFCPETIHISGCINVHICIFAIAIVLHVNIHDYCNHLYFFFFFFLFSFYLSHHCSCVTPNPYQIQLKISLINQNQNQIKPNEKLMKNPTKKNHQFVVKSIAIVVGFAVVVATDFTLPLSVSIWVWDMRERWIK